jgi:acyl-coenzyme A thioesterase PaaI-like protein
MTIERLSNERWGFASNCFVCETKNAAGLGIPFFHDTDTATVFADFTLDDRFSGAPAYLHGGVTLAVLDEAMAWAAIAVAGQWAVTHTTATTFDKPVRVDQPYRVEARIDGVAEDRIDASASVLDGRGTVRARSTATFVALGAAQAIDAIGTAPAGTDTEFLRD